MEDTILARSLVRGKALGASGSLMQGGALGASRLGMRWETQEDDRRHHRVKFLLP